MALLLALPAVPAAAQDGQVRLEVQPAHVGVAGVMRRGGWGAMLISIEDRSAQPRTVRCQWLAADLDGDVVQWQRTIALTPRRVQRTWLYAPIPVNATDRDTWRIDVVDDQSGHLLATQQVGINDLVPAQEAMIAVTGASGLGLAAYSQDITQHERIRFVRGVNPSELPDRWHGLTPFGALIWTPEVADPTSPNISLEVLRAVREWVRRGGHLIVVVDDASRNLWGESALADLMPPVRMQTQLGGPMPWFLGTYASPQVTQLPAMNLTVLEPTDDSVSVLLRGGREQDLPLVVAHQFGFGRVTLIGVDLTDRRLAAGNLPNGTGLWSAVFGWRGPAFDAAQLRQRLDNRDFSEAVFRPSPIELGSFIPGQIAMSGTAAAALLAAIALFAVYWVAAGPLAFAWLKQRKRQEHSWLAFTAVVLAFAVIAWGGALVLRPTDAAIEHISILDIDGRTNTVRSHSWLALFVPTYDRVRIELDPASSETSSHTLVAQGILPEDDQAGFLDTQRYAVSAVRPNRVDMPMRATPKQMALSYLAPAAEFSEAMGQPWVVPDAMFSFENGWWSAKVSHGLPGVVRDIIVVYCKGGGETPMAWRHSAVQWAPGELLQIDRPEATRLNMLHVGFAPNAHRDTQSHLGRLTGLKPGRDIDIQQPVRTRLSRDRWIPLVELLSFYGALPPPNYLWDGRNDAIHFHRAVGREFDMTHMLHLRRLIVIGFMENSPLPAPLQVDGRQLPSRGWTVVRWTHPLPPDPPAAPATAEPIDLDPTSNP